jgi:GT2 family glycosyltransferase
MYFEEVDLCRRFWVAGRPVAFVATAPAIHVHAASTRQTTARQVAYYLSYARYARKHFPPASARVLCAAIWVRTILAMVALPVKYRPTTIERRQLLAEKLRACQTLLRQLRVAEAVR